MAKYEKVTDYNTEAKTTKLGVSELSTKVRNYHIRLLYEALVSSEQINITPMSAVSVIANLLYEDANRFDYTYLNANDIEANINNLVGQMSEKEAKNGIVTELNNKKYIQEKVSFFADKFFGVINPKDTLDGRMSYYGNICSVVSEIK